MNTSRSPASVSSPDFLAPRPSMFSSISFSCSSMLSMSISPSISTTVTALPNLAPYVCIHVLYVFTDIITISTDYIYTQYISIIGIIYVVG